MRSGSTRLGLLAGSCDASRDAWMARYGKDFAAQECSRGFKGKHGCDKNFPAWCASWNLKWGQPNTPAAGAYPDYAAADRKIRDLISQVESCSSSASDIPSSWKLAPPASGAPADVVAAYDSYSLRRYQEFPEAIQSATAFCRAGSSSGGSTATDPNASNPGGWSAVIGDNGNPYGQETYSPDIYTPTAATGGTQVNPGSNYGTVVANPFAPPPAAQPAPKSHRKAYAVGAAALLVAGVAVVAFRKRRSGSRRRSSR